MRHDNGETFIFFAFFSYLTTYTTSSVALTLLAAKNTLTPTAINTPKLKRNGVIGAVRGNGEVTLLRLTNHLQYAPNERKTASSDCSRSKM